MSDFGGRSKGRKVKKWFGCLDCLKLERVSWRFGGPWRRDEVIVSNEVWNEAERKEADLREKHAFWCAVVRE